MPDIDWETLRNLHSIADLQRHYREKGFSGDLPTVLLQAQNDFYAIASAHAADVTQAPSTFTPEIVVRDGVEYHIYGVIHGMLGGDDKDYLRFVSKPIASADHVLFENGLNYFYKHKSGQVIPDFAVLGLSGSLSMGFYVGLSFPLHLWELFTEFFKRSKGRNASEGFLFDSRYYSLGPELRRGVEPQPPLPSRLQIELEMGTWSRSPFRSRIKDPFALVPRSMFMAGYAVGVSRARTGRPVVLVVGDLHTMEIVRFLEDPAIDHPVFRSGLQHGSSKGLRRKAKFLGAKFLHLILAALGGGIILITILTALMWTAMRWLLP